MLGTGMIGREGRLCCRDRVPDPKGVETRARPLNHECSTYVQFRNESPPATSPSFQLQLRLRFKYRFSKIQ